MSGISRGRRYFFRDAARETLVWCEELCGLRHVRLSDIPGFPPQVFAALVPQVRPGVEILVDAGSVSARLPGSNQAVHLFDASDPVDLHLFNLFNGQLTVAQAAEKLSASTGRPLPESQARTRAFFLRLVELRVCVPSNPPPENGSRAIASGG